MEMANTYNGTVLVVDLAQGECETLDLEEEWVKSKLGGAALNLELYRKYAEQDPIIFGSGLLTATFVPCSSAAIVTAKSPLRQSIGHAAFTWQTGIELKLTGFDFVVILGKSEKPVRLWLHDGLADIDDSEDVWGQTTWETTDALRKAYGDDLIQVLSIGKAGESGHALAQISENYWGSKDKFGFGALMGAKNVKALALRGLGALEVPDGFFGQCIKLMKAIRGGAIKGKAGAKDIIPSLALSPEVGKVLTPMVHRDDACFNCPYPCNTFVKYREASDVMASTDVEEPGCLITDLSGFSAFISLGKDAPAALEKCFKLGIEPTASAMLVKSKGKADLAGVLEGLDTLADSGGSLSEADLPNFFNTSPWPVENGLETSLPQAFGVFSNAVPPKPVIASPEAFSAGSTPEERAYWWVRRQALAHTLGICPIFAVTSPELTEEKLTSFIQMALEWEECDSATLDSVLNGLIADSLILSPRAGEIHPSLKGDNLEDKLKELEARFAS